MLTKVLHLGSEHCAEVARVGFCVRLVGADEVEESCAFRLLRAHSPACVHLWAVSERWSRQ